MRGLVLAEKPSLMRAIKDAYDSGSYPFQLEFAAFHGHLMAMAEPEHYHAEWKQWSEASLPMIPDEFLYLPVDKRTIMDVMGKVNRGGFDFVVNACDAGREGEHIFWSFYEANKMTLPVKRLWCSTTVESDLADALHHLHDASEFQNLRDSAKLRAQFDWLVGMNFSRATSIKTRKTANIGRVVTPTLAIVVAREEEIATFKPTPFYEVGAALERDGVSFPGVVLVPPENKATRFTVKETAEKMMATLTNTGTVVAAEGEEKSTKAPTLYSTLEMQKDANKYYKWRANKTDAIAQELYEAGFISYPRTKCRFISTSLVPEIPKLLKPLGNFPEFVSHLAAVTPAVIKAVTAGKDYVDDAKLEDHHAIIPTAKVFDPAKLSDDQRKLYMMIAKRFLSIFMAPYKILSTTVLVDSNNVLLKATGRMVLDKGFSVLYDDKSKNMVLPALKKGDLVTVSEPKVRESMTQPPPRYTERTLLDAMANAGRFVSAAEQRATLKESEGLGTSETRSSTFVKLEKTGMVRIEKDFYVPTEFGKGLIEVLRGHSICSPSMTAEWEKRLRDVEQNGHPETFRADMQEFVRSETKALLAEIDKDLSASDRKVLGKCPLCGAEVIVGKNYYRCENYKETCSFVVSRKNVMGTSVSEKDMVLMLEGKTTEVKDLVAKDGRSFRSALAINETGRVGLALAQRADGQKNASKDNVAAPTEGFCKCPLCDGQIYRSKNYFLCTNRPNGCGFLLRHTLLGAEIKEADVKDLAAGKATRNKRFVWKSGKTGYAQLIGKRTKGPDGKPGFTLEFQFPKD